RVCTEAFSGRRRGLVSPSLPAYCARSPPWCALVSVSWLVLLGARLVDVVGRRVAMLLDRRFDVVVPQPLQLGLVPCWQVEPRVHELLIAQRQSRRYHAVAHAHFHLGEEHGVEAISRFQ